MLKRERTINQVRHLAVAGFNTAHQIVFAVGQRD